MVGEQTFEGRRENLNQANKLSPPLATLLEALNRHLTLKTAKTIGLTVPPTLLAQTDEVIE